MGGGLAGAALRTPRHLVGQHEGGFEEVVDGVAQIHAGALCMDRARTVVAIDMGRDGAILQGGVDFTSSAIPEWPSTAEHELLMVLVVRSRHVILLSRSTSQ
jgi:hypothetical protein